MAMEFAWAWLIERSDTHAWWDGRGPTTFTRDPTEVVRFARKEDAERVAAWLNLRQYVDGILTATEHGWHGPVIHCATEAAEGWRFYFWKFVHNAIVHPLLSTPWEPQWLTRIHDWTGARCKGAG